MKDCVSIGEDFGWCGFPYLEDRRLILDQAAHRLHCVPDQDVRTDWSGMEFLLRGLNAGHHEEVLREAVHAGGVLENRGEELAGLGTQRGLMVEESLDIAG